MHTKFPYLTFNWWLDYRQILSSYGLAQVDVMKTFVSARSYRIDDFYTKTGA
jgi:hypothetical protein